MSESKFYESVSFVNACRRTCGGEAIRKKEREKKKKVIKSDTEMLLFFSGCDFFFNFLFPVLDAFGERLKVDKTLT